MAKVSNKKNGLVFAKPKEHQIQASVIDWAWNRSGIPVLKRLYSIRNGFKGNAAVFGKAKREGLNSGVPDLHLPCSRRGFHGLWIEMKRPGETLSDPQEDWEGFLLTENFCHQVCCEAEHAIEWLLWYVDLNARDPRLSEPGYGQLLTAVARRRALKEGK